MQTTVNIVGWNDAGVVLEERRFLSSNNFLLELPYDKLRYLLGMWRILDKPKVAYISEDNQLIFKANQ